MLLFRKSLLAAACCLLVAGCASSGSEDSVAVESAVPSGQEGILEGAYPAMAQEMSGGSVRLYGLDGDIPSTAEERPVASVGSVHSDGGVVAGADPNVTVYPFSSPGVAGVQSAPLTPPPAQYEYGAHAASAAPQAVSGGASLIDEMQPSMPAHRPSPMEGYGAPSAMGMEGVRVYFRHGSARLTAHDIESIRAAARAAGERIVVEGHASHKTGTSDPVESSIVNLKMSMDRAFAVSSALIRGGVPLSMIETRAFGDGMPVSPADGKDSEAESRRVDILTGRPVMGAD